MTPDEIIERATIATYRIAHDEQAHEMFLDSRRELEALGITREALYEFTLSYFAKCSECDEEAKAKADVFMWLIDNV